MKTLSPEIKLIWNSDLDVLGQGEDTCLLHHQNLFYYFAAAVNISSDLMIALTPIPQLWKLSLTLKKRVLLSAIFGVGFM